MKFLFQCPCCSCFFFIKPRRGKPKVKDGKDEKKKEAKEEKKEDKKEDKKE